MEFSNKFKQVINETLPGRLVKNLNHPGIGHIVETISPDVSENSAITTDYELNMAAIGAKPFIYLPAELENLALLETAVAQQVYLEFLERVVFPQAAEYVAYILEFLESGEGPQQIDPDLIARISKEIDSVDDVVNQSEILGKTDEIPVPKPPKFVSPKLEQVDKNHPVANIRPKPHQGTDDPYREAVD